MTAAELSVRSGSPRGDPPIPQPLHELRFPTGTVVSTFLCVKPRMDHIGSDGEHGRRLISHEFHLVVLGQRVRLTAPEYVEIYVVRADGSVVRHRPVSEAHPLHHHKPCSVFQVLGPGNVLRIRVFANVKNTTAKLPKEHRCIPQVPGMVLVLVRNNEGERPERHVFLCPSELDHVWATDTEKKPKQNRSRR